MRDKTYHAYLDNHERQLVIHSLVELKNRLIRKASLSFERRLNENGSYHTGNKAAMP